jgi:tRNA(adenine34) deaminase
MEEYFMKEALKQAKKALINGDIPVGAIIVRDNEIISKAYNMREKTKSVINHAEIIAINKASRVLKDWRLNDCKMYVTLEPCEMCIEVIKQARIKKVIYGAKNFGNKKEKVTKKSSKNLIINEECTLILKNFFEVRRKS